MKNYLKTTAGILLSATMVTAPHADVTIGELQGFTGPVSYTHLRAHET